MLSGRGLGSIRGSVSLVSQEDAPILLAVDPRTLKLN